MYCVLTAVRLLENVPKGHSSKQRNPVKRNYSVYSTCGGKVADGKWNCKGYLPLPPLPGRGSLDGDLELTSDGQAGSDGVPCLNLDLLEKDRLEKLPFCF